MHTIKTILLLSFLTLTFTSCALYHHYGSYYGKIVDEETKKPLEGVVVLADYYTWLHASPGGPGVYFLDTQEVVTDQSGEFKIPSLNAFAFRPLSTFNEQPYFIIFKPHYECYTRPIPENRYEPIGLRELKSKAERLDNLSCTPTKVPNDKMMQLRKLQDVERIELGLKPGFLRGEQR